MRIFLIPLCVLLLASCNALLNGDQGMIIKNGCEGSWAVVIDGDGRNLHARLTAGSVFTAELVGRSKQKIELFATLYDLRTNADLGEVKTERRMPDFNGGPTAPSAQIDPWTINCPSRR